MGNWASRKRWSQQADSQPAGQSSTGGGGDDDDGGGRAAKSSLDLSDRPPSNLYNKSMKKVKSTPNISQKSSQNGSVQRQKSLKGRTERPVISSNHPLSPSAREIITSCFDNPHQDIGNRICMRMFEKRGDYQMFIYALGKDKWPEITANLRDFMNAVVSFQSSFSHSLYQSIFSTLQSTLINVLIASLLSLSRRSTTSATLTRSYDSRGSTARVTFRSSLSASSQTSG